MPSKLKVISVRLPDDLRKWVEGQKGSANAVISALVRQAYEERSGKPVKVNNGRELINRPVQKVVVGDPTNAQTEFRRRMLKS